MMVDCWRRLYFYWKSRRNWKSVAWHYTYEWHAHKMKGNVAHCCAHLNLAFRDGVHCWVQYPACECIKFAPSDRVSS
jgi:hypothetical protein